MLSILIPTYNYDTYKLVATLYKQATDAKIVFEILVYDDNSNLKIENNYKIKDFPHTKFISLKKNIGRIAIRNLLANDANFEWLLFLDSDVIPRDNTFIKNYISNISSEYDTFYGGFAYENFKPKSSRMLRWKYGKRFEEIDASKRNKNPYQIVISGNFLIRKDVYKRINSRIKRKSYGLDNYFGILLKQDGIRVKHLNNQVFHLGLDENEIYLNKIEEAIQTLLWLLEKRKNFPHDNKLLGVFCLLKNYKLNYIVAYCFKFSASIIKKNLIGPNPNILLIQYYKLGYMCYKDLNS